MTLLVLSPFLMAEDDYRCLRGVWKFKYNLFDSVLNRFVDYIEITEVTFSGSIEAQNYKTGRKIKGHVRNDIILLFEKEDVGNESWLNGLEGYLFHLERNKRGKIKIKFAKHIFIRNDYILFIGWQDELSSYWDKAKVRQVQAYELAGVEKITEESDSYFKSQALIEIKSKENVSKNKN